MSISAGDTATVSVTAHSSTSGAATIKNLSNGQLQQVELSSDYALCRQNAEWIVENPADQYGDLLPFANFGRVTFYDATASGRGAYSPHGANIAIIQQDDDTLTSVSTDGSSVTITYV